MQLLGVWAMLVASTCIAIPLSRETRSKKQDVETYDYIVVGCGPSGLVVSSRLSEDETTSVLCLEAGALDHFEDEILVPYYIGLQPPGFYEWGIFTLPQIQLDGASRHIAMGLGVGGGTLTNGMVWNRGNRASFNTWGAMGNEGWNWNSLIPYFQRSETFTPKAYPDQDVPPTPFDSSIHGSSGPVQVSYPNYFWRQSNNWFDALEALNVSIDIDPNNGLSAGGYFLPLCLDPSNQTRSDARLAYYDPVSNRTNLRVVPNARVVLIDFDAYNGLRATGVQYVQNGVLLTVYADQEVILAAGAIHTPQLLELSGIGQANLLQEHGIDVLQDLPGVGNNLQDHALIHLNYPYQNPNIVDVNDFAMNITFDKACAEEYYAHKTGPWTAKPSQAVAFPSLQQFASDPAGMLEGVVNDDTDYLPSHYEATLRAGYAQQQANIVEELWSRDTPAFENLNDNAGGLDIALMRPLSRGTTHITSTSASKSPAVDPRWLTHPFDRQVLIEAIRFNQRILDTPQIQQLQPSYSQVPRDASIDQINGLLDVGIGTEFHYAGTAAMLPRDLGGVVDTNLLVYGTTNLRIVDTSIYPVVPGAHLQAVAYAVAERASDIIRGVQNSPA